VVFYLRSFLLKKDKACLAHHHPRRVPDVPPDILSDARIHGCSHRPKHVTSGDALTSASDGPTEMAGALLTITGGKR
jgi:hypothetical protein